MNLITCKQLSLSYDSLSVVHDLSFSIEEGNLLYIIGENGSGKSTLVKTILGLTPPLSGKFNFKEGFSHKNIGYLPQQSSVQRDFPASVLEIVLSGFLGKKGWRPFYTKEEKKMAVTYLKEMNIEDLKYKTYRNLSGGQQQRVLLARALCAAEELLVLDEPVTGLDPTAQAELYQMIDHLNKHHRLTILMISHDIPGAVKYSNKIIHLEENHYFFGSKMEYKNSDLYAKTPADFCGSFLSVILNYLFVSFAISSAKFSSLF
jgi:zinc transport system ATP-binding protein